MPSAPEGVLLTGRLPVHSAEQAFRTAGARLGRHLRSIPDGEVGKRDNWILFQQEVFDAHPAFERESRHDAGTYGLNPFGGYRLKAGVDPATVDLRPLGYLDFAVASYEALQRLRRDGAVPTQVRFQVSLPTPLAPVALFADHDAKALVLPVYEEALVAELRAIQDAIPPDDLAVQLDIATEVAMWEKVGGAFAGNPGDPFDPWFGDVIETTAAYIARVADTIDERVRFGLHLCYGSFHDEHFFEPRDLSVVTAGANALAAATARRIDWIHMPVPISRDDDAYFAPLSKLRVDDATVLYLGLIHVEDGEEGALRRIAAAQRFVERFGVATECGIAGNHAEQLPALLDLHAAVAAPVAAES